MKHLLPVGIAGGLLFVAGCQSLNWTAKNKSSTGESVAQNTTVREVPWSLRKKKAPDVSSDLPPEIQAKFDQAKDRSAATKSAAQWYAEGTQLEMAGNFAAATRAYESAISIDPSSAEAHHRLGIMADMRQEYGTAEDHYKAALRQKPHDANILSDFGYSHSLRGNPQQSERYLLQALDLETQHKQATKNLGTLYASQGRYDDALQTFRRLRGDADAQKLVAEYFPKGRPIPDGDKAELVSSSAKDAPIVTPKSAANADPTNLKDLTPDEVMLLMERRRQEAVRQREQRDVADLRQNLQPSINQDEWGRLPNNASPQSPKTGGSGDSLRTPEWAQSPPATAARDAWPNTSFPASNGGNLAAATPPSSSSSFNPPMSAGTPSATNSMPIWSGRTDMVATPGPVGNAAPPPNNPLTSQPPPSWWNEEFAERAPNTAREAFGASPQQAPAAPGDGGPSWGGSSNPVVANPSAGNSATNAPFSRQLAYQLGMSAGPGTMFPAMPAAEVVSNVTNHQPAAAPPAGFPGTQWSNTTTSAGYNESRAMGASPSYGGSADGRWQEAPTDVAPRSPTENWGSPTSVPWPDRSTDQALRESPAPRQPTGMPLIQSRATGAGEAPLESRGEPPSNAPASGTSDGSRSSSDVVPAWYGSPAPQNARPRAATPVPQWPYAPK